MTNHAFHLNQTVRIKALPSATARITDTTHDQIFGPRYRLFVDTPMGLSLYRFEAELEAVWVPVAGQPCSYINLHGDRVNGTIIHVDEASGKAWVRRTRKTNLVVPTADLAECVEYVED